METFSALLAICAGNSPVTSELPSQRPVTRSFDVFVDLRLNNRLSKQWSRLVIWDAIPPNMTSLQWCQIKQCIFPFIYWGRVTNICVGNLTIIGSANGLSPGRRQAITWTNVGIVLIGPLGTNFSEMLIEIHTFSFKKIHFKMSSGKWRPFCLGLNVFIRCLLRWNTPAFDLCQCYLGWWPGPWRRHPTQ